MSTLLMVGKSMAAFDATMWVPFGLCMLLLIYLLPRTGIIASLFLFLIRPAWFVIFLIMLFEPPFTVTFMVDMRVNGFLTAVGQYLFIKAILWTPFAFALYFDYKNRSRLFRWFKK
ncbi:MAG TPA: hypothetical protein P5056_01920 [Candidatus Paceibacterota bacterium]|nr:hypothetical protein [Candidatus Paceibacterota bacterium]